MTVRVRFAPSPTGYLHVGGARTALFSWLFARKEGGQFLLRIEDTDKARSTDEHTQVILDGLQWLGLDWDEQPIFQGARLARHQQVADQLLKEEKAYMEEDAIRLRVPPGELAWDDAVHGRISFKGEDIRDFVILRSDRSPLYNFAVVVDDIDMQITHVLRGDDHISNTPKQIAVYHALDAPLPVFGHVPMIHGADGKKLSKRTGAVAAGKTRSRTTLDIARQVAVRLDEKFVTLDDKAKKEIAKDPTGYRAALAASVVALKNAEWTHEGLEQALRNLAEERNVAAGKVFQPIRIALTGGTVSEPVNELLFVVGKEAALRRLEAAALS